MAREVYLTEQKLIFNDESTARDSERFHDLVVKLEQKGFNKLQIQMFLSVVADDEFSYCISEYDEPGIEYLLKGDGLE